MIPNDHVEIWYIVQAAQVAAMYAARNGSKTHLVDDTARGLIRGQGYGQYFTHRLGHGIIIQ